MRVPGTPWLSTYHLASLACRRGVLIAGLAFGVLHNSGGRNPAFAAWASLVRGGRCWTFCLQCGPELLNPKHSIAARWPDSPGHHPSTGSFIALIANSPHAPHRCRRRSAAPMVLCSWPQRRWPALHWPTAWPTSPLVRCGARPTLAPAAAAAAAEQCVRRCGRFGPFMLVLSWPCPWKQLRLHLLASCSRGMRQMGCERQFSKSVCQVRKPGKEGWVANTTAALQHGVLPCIVQGCKRRACEGCRCCLQCLHRRSARHGAA